LSMFSIAQYDKDKGLVGFRFILNNYMKQTVNRDNDKEDK